MLGCSSAWKFHFLSLLVNQLAPWIWCVFHGNNKMHWANEAQKKLRFTFLSYLEQGARYCWRVSPSATHKHELWIWFTLSYVMMKALLRLAAVRDTKQAGELRGDTVHFIALSSTLVLMTQNGNIYRPVTQTVTCLLRLYSSKHAAENS